MIDLDSHMMFIGELVDGDVLSKEPSMTYAYYHANVKPKPQPKKAGKWVCKVCGYVHEGDELPEDFICPWCKHPASDFEYVPAEEPKKEEAKPLSKWVCKICGYVHEGEELPEGYVCPLCLHGTDDFEPIGEEGDETVDAREQLIKKMVHMHLNGCSYRKIAQECGVSDKTVKRWIEAALKEEDGCVCN